MHIQINEDRFHEVWKEIHIKAEVYGTLKVMVDALHQAIDEGGFKLDDSTPEGRFLFAVWENLDTFIKEEHASDTTRPSTGSDPA